MMGIFTLNLYLIHHTISRICMSPQRMFLFILIILPFMFFFKKKKKKNPFYFCSKEENQRDSVSIYKFERDC